LELLVGKCLRKKASMVNNLLPQKNKKKKELTEKQLAYLDALMENGGNNPDALRSAGYSENSGRSVMNRLSEEIIERAQQMLAANSIKAASGLVNALDDDGTLPRAELKIKAAESILNRVGLGRKDTVQHNVTALHGVVLLPSKASQRDPIIINNEADIS
jgi:hypothetical protein